MITTPRNYPITADNLTKISAVDFDDPQTLILVCTLLGLELAPRGANNPESQDHLLVNSKTRQTMFTGSHRDLKIYLGGYIDAWSGQKYRAREIMNGFGQQLTLAADKF
jgi:hypothetical protein